MKYISRGQWYNMKVEEFLENSSESLLYLDLYKSEIKRLEKKFPQVSVLIGPKVLSSHDDQRYSCIIEKNA